MISAFVLLRLLCRVIFQQLLPGGLVLCIAQAATATPPPVARLGAAKPLELISTGTLYAVPGVGVLPDTPPAVASVLSDLVPVSRVSVFGGHYLLHARFRHDEAATAWVLAPTNTLIERVEAVLFGSDASVQRFSTGYTTRHDHAMHYGKDVRLQPGVTYELVLHMASPYYASAPRVEVWREPAYRDLVVWENSLVLACLGSLAALGLFNLFIFLMTGGRFYLYYAAQTLLSVWGWAMVFHVPSTLFGWHVLWLHYVPFMLMPAAGAMFCIEFLSLTRYQPRMARLLYGLTAASVLSVPVALWGLPYAHSLATVLIGAWMWLAMIAGLRCWWQGWGPARFFVLAFAAIFIPAMVILPGNVDLIPDYVDNAELLTLVGMAAEALLLALALADRIRLLHREKNTVSNQLSDALEVAHTDALTGIGNRLALDLALQASSEAADGNASRTVLFLIDLDGLKQVNDLHGHVRGDALIKAVATGLRGLLPGQASCYRMGGDEFALVARAQHETALRVGLTRLEESLRDGDFPEAGISYGVAHSADGLRAGDLLQRADHHMYQHKAERKRDRLTTTTAALTEPAHL